MIKYRKGLISAFILTAALTLCACGNNPSDGRDRDQAGADNNTTTTSRKDRNPDDEIFNDITAQGKIQFITDYGTSDEKVHIENDMIASASAGSVFDDTGTSYPIVHIQFTEEGGQIFSQLTSELASTHGVITIVYDGKVISAPSVVAAITDGKAQIAGLDSYEEAQIIASALSSGELPCELEPIEN